MLVGAEDVFKSDATHRIFDGHQFQVADTFLDALARLEPGTIDLILLSCEFREEELSLCANGLRKDGDATPEGASIQDQCFANARRWEQGVDRANPTPQAMRETELCESSPIQAADFVIDVSIVVVRSPGGVGRVHSRLGDVTLII